MSKPTPYAVICPNHGRIYMSSERYLKQLARSDDRWVCPICLAISEFDDANYDKHTDKIK